MSFAKIRDLNILQFFIKDKTMGMVGWDLD